MVLSSIPEALHGPLRAFVFETQPALRPATLAQVLGCAEPGVQAGAAVDRGRRRALARVAPPRRLDPKLLCRDLRGRLAMMPRADWLRLGLCLCVLPSCGQIQRSMDGHFRRVVRELLEEQAIRWLDGMEGFPGEKPVLWAGPGAWRSPEGLAAGGVRAAMSQVCHWPDLIRLRVRLNFEPGELEGPASVAGLDTSWLEIACKALWPDHPWLWS